MNATSVKIRKHPCFNVDWAGFDEIRPINIIIGRNNAGKSRLLDVVQALCLGTIHTFSWELTFAVTLDAQSLKRGFQENVSEGELPGNHWGNHGKHFVGKQISVTMRAGNVISVSLESPDDLKIGLFVDSRLERVVAARKRVLQGVASNAKLPLAEKQYRRLYAERNIGMEQASSSLALGADGHGATNILRRYLTSSSAPRELIQHDLLAALNEVFGADGQFTEIETRLHDKPQEPDQSENHWEIFLAEEKKGLVALSRSGSGLKTVLLVLLNLIVVPALDGRPPSSYVFAFEELETHLHPTLLRRLLLYVEKFIRTTGATVFITTHSSVALDLFGVTESAQIIHVRHTGETATTTTVKGYFDQVGIVAELGVKPSDLLHANGIVWVEGPSDRVYVNRWIDIASGGELKEGRDYICAMYGGALLARAQLVAPDQANAELSNLLRINSNVIVLCDSDRTAGDGEGAKLKDRVIRIQSEVSAIPNGLIWVTAAKEIENYLPAEALKKVFPEKEPRSPEKFESVFPTQGGASFIETQLGRRSIDKAELAAMIAPHLTTANLADRFDWQCEIQKFVGTIRKWNR